MMDRYPDVVNLHFTDVCNYHCSYCFVDKKQQLTLSMRDMARCFKNIKKYFDRTNHGKGRINLVGGEPLAYPYLEPVIDMICSTGMECSIVTNGSLLTKGFIERNKDKISCIGISVDSLEDATNRKIGRCNAAGKTMSRSELEERCGWISEAGIGLKINICYSRLNQKEDIIPFLKSIRPNRIKLLQMLIVKGVNDSSEDDVLSSGEFDSIAKRFSGLNVVSESNDMMENSYLIVNSKGELVGKENGGQRIIGSLLETDFMTLVDQSGIRADRFFRRYPA